MSEDFSGKQVDRYLLASLIGCGAAGSVYQAVDTTLQDSPTFAIKCIHESLNPRRRRQQIAEMDNHDTVACCPHVMMLYDSFEQHHCFFLVFPLCESDMFRTIWKEKVYWRNDALIKEVFVDILDGVFACHKKGVFHRDLKPENIMCNAHGKEIRIGDFGLSSNRRLCRDGGCGTSYYMSPGQSLVAMHTVMIWTDLPRECLDKNEIFYYAEPADIWSLGVILFNMVTCRYPWEEARPTDDEYTAFMAKKDYLLRTSPISESLSMLLCQIWHPTPLRRLPIPAIREAIVEMDTFYKPRRSSHSISPLSKEEILPVVDS